MRSGPTSFNGNNTFDDMMTKLCKNYGRFRIMPDLMLNDDFRLELCETYKSMLCLVPLYPYHIPMPPSRRNKKEIYAFSKYIWKANIFFEVKKNP